MAWITVKKDFDFYPTPRSCLAFKVSDVPVSATQAAADYGVKIGAAEYVDAPNKAEAKAIRSKGDPISMVRAVING